MLNNHAAYIVEGNTKKVSASMFFIGGYKKHADRRV